MTLQLNVQSGLKFLEISQLDNGNWWVEVSNSSDMRDSKQQDNVFSAAVIAREIAAFAPDSPMIARACTFLCEHQRTNGLWNFYKKQDRRLLPADFDTTACAAAALLLAKYPLNIMPVLTQLDQHQHPEGGYWTFAMQLHDYRANPIVNNFHDHVVQVHILVFMALAGVKVDGLIQYLVDVLRSRDYFNPQTFYDSPLLFLSMFARGLAYLEHPLQDLQAEIAQHIRDQASTHALSSLELTYIIRGLLACGDHDIDPWLYSLIAQQAVDGGWPGECFFLSRIHCYGSRPITTALALHAITAYMQERSQA